MLIMEPGHLRGSAASTELRQVCTECALLCRSDSLNLYEEEYWNITANSTGVSYDLNRSVMPWNYTQCAIADSQFFWAGMLHSMPLS